MKDTITIYKADKNDEGIIVTPKEAKMILKEAHKGFVETLIFDKVGNVIKKRRIS